MNLIPIRSHVLRVEASWYWLASHRLRGRIIIGEFGKPLSEETALSCMRSLARHNAEPIRTMALRNLASIGMSEIKEGTG